MLDLTADSKLTKFKGEDGEGEGERNKDSSVWVNIDANDVDVAPCC